MAKITSHVLDTAAGSPAVGVQVTLDVNRDATDSANWETVATGVTDDDGRTGVLVEDATSGHYRITFDVGTWYASTKTRTFFPTVRIEFNLDQADPHYHLPLLLSPFGYTTYRGS